MHGSNVKLKDSFLALVVCRILFNLVHLVSVKRCPKTDNLPRECLGEAGFEVYYKATAADALYKPSER